MQNHARAAVAVCALFQVAVIVVWVQRSWLVALIPAAFFCVLVWVAYILERRYGFLRSGTDCYECAMMGRNCAIHKGRPRD